VKAGKTIDGRWGLFVLLGLVSADEFSRIAFGPSMTI
jgi:hypothetical protein